VGKRKEGQTEAIRQARGPRDWRAARALLEAYATELKDAFGVAHVPEELGRLRAAYPAPGGLFLFWRGRVPVGCVALRVLGPGEAELKRLFTLPSARGRGVGRALVEAALCAARARGFRCIRLDTLPDMEAAQALYVALGFRPTGPYGRSPLRGARFYALALEPAPKGRLRLGLSRG
jgi:ribosomal protein S18 acetylase RimI-like enzyme